MGSLVARFRLIRWLLPLLVAILVLGHVCELSASVEIASHHHSDGSHHSAEGTAHEQPGSCDAVTAASTSGHLHHVWAGADVAAMLRVFEASPVGTTLLSFGVAATLPSRLPLFLLYSSLLI